MRTAFLLPLPVMVAVVAGCGSQGRGQAARSQPERDLTLAAQAPVAEIASPVELGQLQTQPRALRSSRRTFRGSGPIQPMPVPARVTAAPAPAPPVSDSAVQPAGAASQSANGRELLPGKTVTVIPASSGPSTGSDWTDELPTVQGGTFVVRGGGRCPPRGRRPGIGIAAVPRPHFR